MYSTRLNIYLDLLKVWKVGRQKISRVIDLLTYSLVLKSSLGTELIPDGWLRGRLYNATIINYTAQASTTRSSSCFEQILGEEDNSEDSALHAYGNKIEDKDDQTLHCGHISLGKEELEKARYNTDGVHHKDSACKVQFGQDAEDKDGYAKAVSRLYDKHENDDLDRRPGLVSKHAFEDAVAECEEVGRTNGNKEHPNPAFFIWVLERLKLMKVNQ